MYRYALEELIKWKEKKTHKPMILEGARQVGKTWLMKEFAKVSFSHIVYINFDSNSQIKTLFEGDINTSRIIQGLEIFAGYKINPKNTLIIWRF